MKVVFLRNYKEFTKGEMSEINDAEELSYLVNTGTVPDITEEKEEEIESILVESEEIEVEGVQPKNKKGKK